MQQTVAIILGDYVAGENVRHLPEDVIAKAIDCLVDSTGCLLGGYSVPLADILERFVAQTVTAGHARIAGSSRRTDPGTAAFVHATLINALDFDDIYRKGHPGATVVAAALSVASQSASTGLELLEALVAGYEVSTRAGMHLSHLHPRKTIHGHGTWQVLGAAAASAKILKLDAHQSAHALAIAALNAPVASVMKTVYGRVPTMAKNNFGAAAQTGVNAAYLARSGFEGPLDVFEGESGFWRMAGADAGDIERLTAGLGEIYEIRDVGFKAYSCCRILQSSIQAAKTAFDRAGVDAKGAAYKKLSITAPRIVCEPPFSDPTPDSIWAAQFSARYGVAMTLLGVEPGPDWFLEENMGSAIAAAIMERIELRPDECVTRPGGYHRAQAQLQLTDGRTYDATIPVALGEAANPLPAAFLRAKFITLAERKIGNANALALLQTLLNAKDLPTVQSIFAQCAPSSKDTNVATGGGCPSCTFASVPESGRNR